VTLRDDLGTIQGRFRDDSSVHVRTPFKVAGTPQLPDLRIDNSLIQSPSRKPIHPHKCTLNPLKSWKSPPALDTNIIAQPGTMS
jgi:hypothetical protein